MPDQSTRPVTRHNLKPTESEKSQAFPGRRFSGSVMVTSNPPSG